ncbi:MAG: methyltransferase [Pseudomonadota bacterium]
MTEPQNAFLDMFEDANQAANYADGPMRFVPGFSAMHQMANILIQESAPQDAHVLIHGAGGGLELEAFAQANAGWTFTGIDPAKPMLEAARQRLGDLMDRVTLHHGYIDTSSAGPFDAATSLLTLHFLDPAERQRTVSEIVRRLKPGAPFVVVHTSFPQASEHRSAWLTRYRDYAISSGVDPDDAENARKAVSENLELLDPETDENILRAAGLKHITLFYAAFTWRGWFGFAP